MKITSSRNEPLSAKENKYFKLFKFLYEKNQENRNNKINNKKIFRNNNNYFDDDQYNESNKPITVEHFINEDIYYENKNKLQEEYDFGVYYNGDITNSRSNDCKTKRSKSNELIDSDNKINKYYNNITPKNSELQLLSLSNNSFCKRYLLNIKDKYNSMIKRKSFNSSLSYDNNNISFLFIKNKNNEIVQNKKYNSTKNLKQNNTLNIYLLPRRIKKRISNKNIFLHGNKKTKRSTISSNEITKRNEKDTTKAISSKITKNFNKKVSPFNISNKNNSKLYKVKREFNDMNQINRFRQLKKDLIEERIKINNMMSEFFKNPLFIKYNHKEIILDIIKQKNNLTRPKSALS